VSRVILKCTVFVLALAFSAARADELLYSYDASVFPYDPSAGWEIFNPCDEACSESLDSGHLVLTWPSLVLPADRFANYTYFIARSGETPPPPPFWVEWRFASNNPIGHVEYGMDGAFVFGYKAINDLFNMYGDAIISNDAGTFVLGLELDAFRTFRIETPDGIAYCLWYDGHLFRCDSGHSTIRPTYLQMYGSGGFSLPNPPSFIINRWDYVRYGRLTTGEAIVASDPPGGVVDANTHPNLDRFTVTFDQPNYVYVDDITVEAITNYQLPITESEPRAEASGPFDLRNSQFAIPVVVATRRQDNGPPEAVEIVLDRPLAVGTTTRFTFNTGGTPNTVEYTLVLTGACCQTDGTCADSTDADCAATGGAFTAGASCTVPSACCASAGACTNLDPICCAAVGLRSPPLPALIQVPHRQITKSPHHQIQHRSLTLAALIVCEGDADHDGVDGLCDDACPTDPAKTAPGLCGCGVSDVDTDGDTVPDCLDQCPGKDDRIDANGNGVPDCLENPIIPTASTWGLGVLTLLLLIAAKLYFARRQCGPT